MLYSLQINNMLINNNQYNSFLKNAPFFNGFLLYGQDKGQVKYRSLQIIDKIKSSIKSDIIKHPKILKIINLST